MSAKLSRMKSLYFDAKGIKYTAGDYIKANAEMRAGMMEIQGERPEQEDQLLLSKIPYFEFLDKKERAEVLASTFQVLQKNNEKAESGSTACVLLAKAEKGLVRVNYAAIGDSEGYLVRKSKKGVKVERLNALHTPKDPSECERIKKSGREIIKGRIKKNQSTIAVTRAIGDHGVLEVGDHVPEIDERIFSLRDDEEAFIVVACDGLFELKGIAENHTDESKEKFVADEVEKGENPFYMALGLVGNAYCNGSGDNISVAVMQIKLGMQTVCGAVFDGHGGYHVAKNLAKTFLPTLFQFIKEKIYAKKKQFLLELDKELVTASKLDILQKFEEIKNKDGRYAFIHMNRNPFLDKLRLFFKSNCNAGEKDFFQTATYELAVKKLQEKYVSLNQKLDEKNLGREQRFIDYVTGNGMMHLCETTARKKMRLQQKA